jgi:hypothetical protein
MSEHDAPIRRADPLASKKTIVTSIGQPSVILP